MAMISQSPVALTLTWTDSVAASLHALETSKDLPHALRSIASGEVPSAPVSATDGKTWKFAENGKLVIPVVQRRAGDPLYDPSLALARIVVRALQEDTAAASYAANAFFMIDAPCSSRKLRNAWAIGDSFLSRR
jgi:hypothetical protein